MPDLSFMCVLCLYGQELLDWINKVLADCKITVKDIEKDLSDGEILQMLIGENPPPPPIKYCEIIHFMLIFIHCQFFRG